MKAPYRRGWASSFWVWHVPIVLFGSTLGWAADDSMQPQGSRSANPVPAAVPASFEDRAAIPEPSVQPQGSRPANLAPTAVQASFEDRAAIPEPTAQPQGSRPANPVPAAVQASYEDQVAIPEPATPATLPAAQTPASSHTVPNKWTDSSGRRWAAGPAPKAHGTQSSGETRLATEADRRCNLVSAVAPERTEPPPPAIQPAPTPGRPPVQRTESGPEAIPTPDPLGEYAAARRIHGRRAVRTRPMRWRSAAAALVALPPRKMPARELR